MLARRACGRPRDPAQAQAPRRRPPGRSTTCARRRTPTAASAARRGQGSTQLHSGWVALGLAAADRNPRAFQRGGASPVDYIRGGLGSLRDTGELERTILVVRAAGLSPRDFGGRDLIAELQSKRRVGRVVRDDQLDRVRGAVAAGERRGRERQVGVVSRQAAELGRRLRLLAGGGIGCRRHRDGAAGARGRRQARELHDAARRSRISSARSTRTAAGGRCRRSRRTRSRPRGPCRGSWRRGATRRRSSGAAGRRSTTCASLQRGDGSFRYSRSSSQTPVWVTAQALVALERKAFPLAAVAMPARGGLVGRVGVQRGTQARGAGRRRIRLARRGRETPDAESSSEAEGAPAPGAPAAPGSRTSARGRRGRRFRRRRPSGRSRSSPPPRSPRSPCPGGAAAAACASSSAVAPNWSRFPSTIEGNLDQNAPMGNCSEQFGRLPVCSSPTTSSGG